MEARYVVFVIVLLSRILVKKMEKMLYFVRVVVIGGYTINMQVSEAQLFSNYQIQTNLFACVFTAFYQIKLFK